MITDSFSSTAAWMQVQAALTKPGATNIVLALLVVGIVALAADYTHMLYLHYKMVSLARNFVHGYLAKAVKASRTTAMADSRKHVVIA